MEAMNDPFAAVIESIDQMLADLRKEEAEDLQKKEYCEKERTEKTQIAKMTSAQKSRCGLSHAKEYLIRVVQPRIGTHIGS